MKPKNIQTEIAEANANKVNEFVNKFNGYNLDYVLEYLFLENTPSKVKDQLLTIVTYYMRQHIQEGTSLPQELEQGVSTLMELTEVLATTSEDCDKRYKVVRD